MKRYSVEVVDFIKNETLAEYEFDKIKKAVTFFNQQRGTNETNFILWLNGNGCSDSPSIILESK